MHYTYNTVGVCSTRIDFDVEGGIVHNVVYQNGCHGNLQGIAALVDGLTVDEVESKLGGICCGRKSTSCPDQLAIAVRNAFNESSK